MCNGDNYCDVMMPMDIADSKVMMLTRTCAGQPTTKCGITNCATRRNDDIHYLIWTKVSFVILFTIVDGKVIKSMFV